MSLESNEETTRVCIIRCTHLRCSAKYFPTRADIARIRRLSRQKPERNPGTCRQRNAEPEIHFIPGVIATAITRP